MLFGIFLLVAWLAFVAILGSYWLEAEMGEEVPALASLRTEVVPPATGDREGADGFRDALGIF